MKLNRRYEIDRIVSKDPARQNLANCYLDVEAKQLVATDGHAMALVPVTGLDESPGDCPHDESGFVAAEAIKLVRKKTSKRDPLLVLAANGKHVFTDGSTMPRPTADQAFPPYQRVVPAYRRGDPKTVTVGLAPELLCQLAKAIGTEGTVALTFPLPEPGSEMLEPFVVEGEGGALGVLMPARV